MRALLSTVAVGLLLAACGPQTSRPADSGAATTTEPPRSAAVVGPILITFSETGAGEINGATRLSVRSVTAYFPDATIRRAPSDGAEGQIITVRRPDGLALDLHPGADPERVGQILGRAGPVVGPLGEEIGASWGTLGLDLEGCGPGEAEWAQALVCYRPGQPKLGYILDLAGYEGPVDEALDLEFLDQGARLSAFVWTAETV